MEAILSSETWFHTRVTRRNIPEDGILHSHRSENLKSHRVYVCFLSYVPKAIAVTGGGDVECCGMFRILQCLNSRLTDGGEAISLNH
jgi:hypothetical protein